jgi:hypothetical protein
MGASIDFDISRADSRVDDLAVDHRDLDRQPGQLVRPHAVGILRTDDEIRALAGCDRADVCLVEAEGRRVPVIWLLATPDWLGCWPWRRSRPARSGTPTASPPPT